MGSGGEARLMPPTAIGGLKAGDMVAWRSDVVHANLPPQNNRIQRRLRRLVGYVCLTPRKLLHKQMDSKSPKAYLADRRLAAARGYTGSHYPRRALENNYLLYPRAKSSEPVLIPAECHKTEFSALELALL